MTSLLLLQNLALNIAEKGFPISVYNRSASKTDDTVERAKKEGNLPVQGYHDVKEFVESIEKPRYVRNQPKAHSNQSAPTIALAIIMQWTFFPEAHSCTLGLACEMNKAHNIGTGCMFHAKER